MLYFSHHRRAETILETIIAVSLLLVVISAAAPMYVTASRSSAANRDDLIGKFLSEEGVELMQKIRDSNILRFSPKAQDCWNTKPDHTDIDTCDAPGNKIAVGIYTLEVNFNEVGAVKFTQQPSALDPDNLADEYQLKLDPVTKLYNYTQGTPTKFYREISIDYTPSGDMYVISRVFYTSGNSIRRIYFDNFLSSQPL